MRKIWLWVHSFISAWLISTDCWSTSLLLHYQPNTNEMILTWTWTWTRWSCFFFLLFFIFSLFCLCSCSSVWVSGLKCLDVTVNRLTRMHQGSQVCVSWQQLQEFTVNKYCRVESVISLPCLGSVHKLRAFTSVFWNQWFQCEYYRSRISPRTLQLNNNHECAKVYFVSLEMLVPSLPGRQVY